MNLLLLAQIPMALTQLTSTALARHKWLLMKDKTIKAHQPLPTRGSSRTERRMLALRPWQGAFSWTGEHSILDAECLAEQNGGLYIGAESEDDLIAALRKTLDCPMSTQRAVP